MKAEGRQMRTKGSSGRRAPEQQKREGRAEKWGRPQVRTRAGSQPEIAEESEKVRVAQG